MLKYIAIFVIFIVIIIIIWKKSMNELFTNEIGYFSKPSDCDSMTLKDCLSMSTCGWCMNDNFTSKCVAGDSHGPTNATCKKYYSSDSWSRAEIAGDNDYTSPTDLPLFE